MNRACAGCLLALFLFSCGASSQNSDGGTPGSGGTGSGPTGSGGAAVATPLFVRADCGSIAAGELKAGTSQAMATRFAAGTLIGGRVDPDSVTNQEHHWAIQLAPGHYHLVLDARTANGDSTNVGIKATRGLANGGEEQLVFGNEIARRYRDEAFFEVTASALVPLKVVSNFGMEDYLLGVFANGTPVPSPLFDKCPTVVPLTVGQPAAFTLGADSAATGEQWFVVDLTIGNYKFMLDAEQADGVSTNLIYSLDVLDRFGEESRAKEVVFANEIDSRFSTQGTLAVGETGSYWVRLRNGGKDLHMTMTVSSQAN